MTIKQAKEYIRQTVSLYLKKDEFLEYCIPVVRQRPIFLLGAPGVGKTAIMEQIASEMGIAIVSYSMTHHTRQSALGLPYIEEKNYDGNTVRVSEYTMSEIISTVYETMEKSGKKEGILFLDEINCVSETLAPSMLQFLQYKVFGRHVVPDGWVVVTAGNPPEYNKSVRDFDVVTLDRLKVLEVEPDYTTFKEYAIDKGLHNVVLSFLELKKDYFYKIETTVSGKSYVTARGWEDLSQILKMYEDDGLKVDETLIEQYIKNDKIVREFGAYYDLYNKYKRDYAIDEILEGNAPENSYLRAKRAGFDERLSLLSMLLDRCLIEMTSVIDKTDYLNELMPVLKRAKEIEDSSLIAEMLLKKEDSYKQLLVAIKSAGTMSSKERKRINQILAFIMKAHKIALSSTEDSFGKIKEVFDVEVASVKDKTQKASIHLKSMFEFVEKAFEGGNEMLIVVTTITSSEQASKFIGRFGSAEYQRFAKELMIGDEMDSVLEEIDELLL